MVCLADGATRYQQDLDSPSTPSDGADRLHRAKPISPLAGQLRSAVASAAGLRRRSFSPKQPQAPSSWSESPMRLREPLVVSLGAAVLLSLLFVPAVRGRL